MYEKILKRVLDFLISFVALILLLPLMSLLTLTGAVIMRENPFFVQKRPGRIDKNTGEEKIFSLIKFRTMKNLTDENGNLIDDKKRLNRYGRFLRNTSLDELPELINILKGDMSFVGPRPLLVKYLSLYSEKSTSQTRRKTRTYGLCTGARQKLNNVGRKISDGYLVY